MAFGMEGDAFSTWGRGPHRITVDAGRGRIRVWVNGKQFEWRDRDPFPAVSYRLGTIGFSGKFNLTDSTVILPHTDGILGCYLGFRCQCTQGFKGALCNVPCEAETYGENCARTCGNCNQRSCDPMTGHCLLGCAPGFHPPMCQDESVYLWSDPNVTALDSGTLNVRADLDNSSTAGVGQPLMYEIHYRPKGSKWVRTAPQPIHGGSVDANISGLAPSTTYRVEVVLLSDRNSKYTGWDVGSTVVKTLCKAPDNFEYELGAHVVEDSRFRVYWHITNTAGDWCPVGRWRVFLREAGSSEWAVYSEGASQSADMAELPANGTFVLKVQAVTVTGQELRHSHEILLTTGQRAPGPIRNLRQTRYNAHEVQISWKAPESDPDVTVHYLVEYQCHLMVACQHESCSSSKGHRLATLAQPNPNETHTFILSDLRPHAIYSITVTALLMDIRGPPAAIKVRTLPSAPGFALDKATVRVHDCTDSSFTVEWNTPRSCVLMNGPYNGVHYELFLTEGGQELFQGDSYGTNRLILNYLRPSTTYLLRLYLVAYGIWDPSHYLEINVATLSIEDRLMVYQRGPKELSLRWRPPKKIRDGLGFFTVSYGAENKSYVTEDVVPEKCDAWPMSFCHTIRGLQPLATYNISVQPRHHNGNKNGDPAFLSAVTKEMAPTAPRSLRVLGQSSDSVEVAWSLPWAPNGQLEQFLVNVHHMDAFDASQCCERVPMIIINATGNRTTYTARLPGLRPASTYNVTVAGVTGAVGELASVVAHTAPRNPVLPGTLDLSLRVVGSFVLVRIPAIDTPRELISSVHLLDTPTPKDTEGLPPLMTKTVHDEIKKKLGGFYTVVAELSPLPEALNQTLYVGADLLTAGSEHRLAMAVTLGYANATSTSIVLSQRFRVLGCFTDGTYTCV